MARRSRQSHERSEGIACRLGVLACGRAFRRGECLVTFDWLTCGDRCDSRSDGSGELSGTTLCDGLLGPLTLTSDTTLANTVRMGFVPHTAVDSPDGGDSLDTAFFSSPRKPNAVTLYDGGIAFDTSDRLDATGARADVTLGVPLKKATGKRLATISLPTDEAFAREDYLSPARVHISSSGSGRCATALAEFDGEALRLTGIRVTSPGIDYDAATTTVEIESATNNNYRFACAFTLTDNAGTGGVTKRVSLSVYPLVRKGCAPLFRYQTSPRERRDWAADDARFAAAATGVWTDLAYDVALRPGQRLGELAFVLPGGGCVRRTAGCRTGSPSSPSSGRRTRRPCTGRSSPTNG